MGLLHSLKNRNKKYFWIKNIFNYIKKTKILFEALSACMNTSRWAIGVTAIIATGIRTEANMTMAKRTAWEETIQSRIVIMAGGTRCEIIRRAARYRTVVTARIAAAMKE